MPTVGALSTMNVQSAGSVLADIEMLAVPFALLLAKNGVEAVMKSKKTRGAKSGGGVGASKSSRSASPPKPRKAASQKPKPKPAPKAKQTSPKKAPSKSTKPAAKRAPRGASKGGAPDVRNTFQELANNISSLLKMHDP